MPRFRYILDPVFLASLAIYWINRLILKPHFQFRFLHDHLNDLLCVAVWVPIVLLIQRKLKLRDHDDPPAAMEILIPLLIWSWIFEVALPMNTLGRSWCTPDPSDIAWYIVGALGAGIVDNDLRRHRFVGILPGDRGPEMSNRVGERTAAT